MKQKSFQLTTEISQKLRSGEVAWKLVQQFSSRHQKRQITGSDEPRGTDK